MKTSIIVAALLLFSSSNSFCQDGKRSKSTRNLPKQEVKSNQKNAQSASTTKEATVLKKSVAAPKQQSSTN